MADVKHLNPEHRALATSHLADDNRLTIHVPRSVLYSSEKMDRLTKNLLDLIGCPCHSGYVFDFQQIKDFVVNPKTLDVTEIGQFAPSLQRVA